LRSILSSSPTRRSSGLGLAFVGEAGSGGTERCDVEPETHHKAVRPDMHLTALDRRRDTEAGHGVEPLDGGHGEAPAPGGPDDGLDRKSTRLNSSHVKS